MPINQSLIGQLIFPDSIGDHRKFGLVSGWNDGHSPSYLMASFSQGFGQVLAVSGHYPVMPENTTKPRTATKTIRA